MHHKECPSGIDQWVVMDPHKQEKEKLSDAWKHENYERESERQTDRQRQREGGRERKGGKERGC